MRLPYRIHWPTEALAIAALAGAAAMSPYFYGRFPDEVPTHWNAAGQPDGFSGPAFAAFFFPALIAAVYLLLVFIPLADPQKDRYREFSRPYGAVRLILTLYLTGIYFLASFAGLGHDIPIAQASAAGVGTLFLVIGNFMPKFHKNWFVGIRTPWTLSSESVWQRTHRLAGKSFTAGGLLVLAASLFGPQTAFAAVLAAIALAGLVPVAYSWWAWREESRRPSPSPAPDETEPPPGL